MSEGLDHFSRALAWAADAHTGQVYRGYNGRENQPYILHPIRVALRVEPRDQVVALLHDVEEDTDRGLPPWLNSVDHEALHLITRLKDVESYAAYIERLAGGVGLGPERARRVKIADIRDNLEHNPPESLRERYEKALNRLKPQPEDSGYVHTTFLRALSDQ